LKHVKVTQWVRGTSSPTRPMASHRVGSRTEVRPLRGGVRSRGKARTQAASLNSEKRIIVGRSQGKAGGTLSPLTVSTKLAWIATKSKRKACEWMGSNSHAPCGLVNCKVVGPQGPSLTNRMSELLTYGSVGGVGGNPGPYPALDAAMTLLLQSGRPRCRASERGR